MCMNMLQINELIQGADPIPALTINPIYWRYEAVAIHEYTKIEHTFQPKKHFDIIGKKFSRLTIVGEAGAYADKKGRVRRAVECLCDCGTRDIYLLTSLTSGNTKSCGCLNFETRLTSRKTHGGSKHPLYKVWSLMKCRCYNPTTPDYRYYGERGITICNEWLNSFQQFFDWAIENGWAKSLVIDRIDNDGSYNPINCRFVDRQVSAVNRRCPSNSTSGYKGVSYHQRSHDWQSRITLKNKRYHCGSFDNPIDAARAYDAKAKELSPDFILNFP